MGRSLYVIPTRVEKVRLAALLFALCCFTAIAQPAFAHPLGNFTINHLVDVRQAGDTLRIRYALDMAEIPTFAVMRSRSATGKLDAAGLRSWAASEVAVVTDGLDMRADGAPLPLATRGAPLVRTRSGAGGLPTLYWVQDFVVRPGKAPALSIDDRTFPDRIGWKDIIITPATDPTGELTHYPSAMLTSPRDVTGANLGRLPNGHWVAATIAAPSAAAAASPSQVRSNALADMLSRGPTSIVVVVLTLITAIGLGALHALEPGHGKTLLAVSLVGARATPKQALFLAAALTLAHTAGVLCLGLALLIAAPWIVPETVYPWITAASGLAVVCLGATALARLARARRVAAHEHEHGHEHDGGSDNHSHGPHGHSHVISGDELISFRGVVLIAMSGNVAPCPAALVVMLAAFASHQLGYGLAIIVAFGFGLAALLTGLGIAVVRGAARIARRPQVARIVAIGPLISAIAISTIGAVMFGQGISSSIIRTPGWAVTLLTLGAIAGYAMRPEHSHAHDHPHSESPNAA
jgi:ABC-type nickel/cobalt efflux system permease component RcnA